MQEFAALSIRLTAARVGEVAEVHRQIDDAMAQVATAAEGLRGLITDLRPASLDQIGLDPALRTMVDRLRALHGMEIELTADLAYERGRESTRLAPELETVAYRLVQEALTNVFKHAGTLRARR